jgi:O-antigen ligase
MLIILLGLLLVFFFFYDQERIIHYLLVFFLLFDMVDGFYTETKIFPLIRYLLPLTIIIFYILRNKALLVSDFVFLILIFYLTLLLIFIPGDLITSAKNYASILIALLMIIVGRHEALTKSFFNKFEPFNRFMMLTLVTYLFLANIFKFGSSYTESFSTGFLFHSRMYIAPIIIFMSLYYLFNNKGNNKYFRLLDIGLVLINIIFLLINTRRTTWGMLLIGIFIYIMINREVIFKMILVVGILIFGLIVSYPLYEEVLTKQLEKRERIQDFDTYEEEGRWLETLYLIQYHKMNQNPYELLFGVKFFDTIEFTQMFFGRERSIHSDINMILYSTGILGMILFFIFYFHYFINGFWKINPTTRQIFFPLLAMFLLVQFPGRFIGIFTYAPLLMFLLAGAKFSRKFERGKKIMKSQKRHFIELTN